MHFVCCQHCGWAYTGDAACDFDIHFSQRGRSMSKHKVIVRTLGGHTSIREMDVLCTDKTGTLTEDKIRVRKYMDVHGKDDERILRHAYLNSYFQTGLKNLIDLAIINLCNE